ncbi:hypothetical protein M8818_000893 [Zalaria obscura]|uniref:Uncharacterized protein n=1 Tax=Zalaria obscura TaxID=2024903 RepID=A0ACC3SLZ1_9PEZI
MSQEARLPNVGDKDSFDVLVQKLAKYIFTIVNRPTTFEEFRTSQSSILFPLVRYLTNKVHNQAIVAALLALKGHFTATENDFEQSVYEARGFACEAVALRFVTNLAHREVIDYLLYELPPATEPNSTTSDASLHQPPDPSVDERSPLISTGSWRHRHRIDMSSSTENVGNEEPSQSPSTDSEFAKQFEGLNALEIAAVCEAKKFLSQKAIQAFITSIWNGDIVFWANLSPNAHKHAQVYQRRSVDPYSRLRVPKLFISPEHLRSTRILLLKVTHAPHVLAISMYERICRYLSDRRLDKTAALNGAETPAPLRRPALADYRYLRSPRPRSAANIKYDLLADEPPRFQSSNATKQAPENKDSVTEMRAMLDQMAVQMEELKAMIARQNTNDGPNVQQTE